jgi:hypothetical protein
MKQKEMGPEEGNWAHYFYVAEDGDQLNRVINFPTP